MPVTKQTYTVTSPWGNSQMAAGFRDAFIGAGLMTDWYDSFLDGAVENRILEITYDASKVYGKTYYWFKFTASQVYVHIATAWNTGTHKPSGTQYLDFYSDTTNSTQPGCNLSQGSFNSSVTTTITRWTSQVDPLFTWFLVRCGSASFNFHINRTPPSSWIDLNKVCYTSMMLARTQVLSRYGSAWFQLLPLFLRRTYIPVGRIDTFCGYYGACNNYLDAYGHTIPLRYLFLGNSDFGGNGMGHLGEGHGAVQLPIGFSNNNPAYATDSNPVFTNLLLNPYSSALLPADFGITGYLYSVSMSVFDQFVVTPGSEIYDILAVSNHSGSFSSSDLRASPLFLARVV